MLPDPCAIFVRFTFCLSDDSTLGTAKSKEQIAIKLYRASHQENQYLLCGW